MRSRTTSFIKTLKPYIWRTVNNHSLRNTKTVKILKDKLAQNGESTDIGEATLGDPDNIFHLHSINPYAIARYRQMLEENQTFILEGSGGCGISDGFFSYIMTGEPKENIPFPTFQSPAGLSDLMDFFVRITGQKKVIFTSNLIPTVKSQSHPPVGVFSLDYNTPIPVQVALAKENDTIFVNDEEATFRFLNELKKGFEAIDRGIKDLAEVLPIRSGQENKLILSTLMSKLSEESDSPIVPILQKECTGLLNKQKETLTLAKQISEIIGHPSLRNDFLRLYEAIDGSPLEKETGLKVEVIEKKPPTPHI